MTDENLRPRDIVFSRNHSAQLEDYPIPDIDADPIFREIFLKTRDYTMTGKLAMHALYEAVRYVCRSQIAGDFVECGTWRGGSALLAALTFESEGVSRGLDVYDTFQGMPPPTEHDVDMEGQSASAYMEQYSDETGWCYAGLDEVRATFSSHGFGEDKVRFIKGDVLETLKSDVPETISILRLDTDWYESTRFELETLYPRLSVGGVLIVDDYGYWQGSRKAVDEYFATRRTPLLMRVNEQVRLAIKIA